jgi:hypothetical protein
MERRRVEHGQKNKPWKEARFRVDLNDSQKFEEKWAQQEQKHGDTNDQNDEAYIFWYFVHILSR